MTGNLEGEEGRVLVKVVLPQLAGRNYGREHPPLSKVAPEALGFDFPTRKVPKSSLGGMLAVTGGWQFGGWRHLFIDV